MPWDCQRVQMSNVLQQNLYKKQWVVYAKKTGKTVNHALEYLARYTNRVAIGNDRITKIKKGKVTFRYKDPKTGKYNREMTLAAYRVHSQIYAAHTPSRVL